MYGIYLYLKSMVITTEVFIFYVKGLVFFQTFGRSLLNVDHTKVYRVYTFMRNTRPLADHWYTVITQWCIEYTPSWVNQTFGRLLIKVYHTKVYRVYTFRRNTRPFTWNIFCHFFNLFICGCKLFLFLPCNCLLHHVEEYAMNFWTAHFSWTNQVCGIMI